MARMTEQFALAMADLQRGEKDLSTLSSAFLAFFPIDGASVATVGGVIGTETLSATTELARRMDEIQFDLREGPCWDAVSLRTSIFESDVRRHGPERWPSLASALVRHEIGSLFAFPMTIGALSLGTVNMYAHAAVSLSAEQQHRAAMMAEVIGRRILRGALVADPDQNAPATTPFSRRLIHQATGFVLAQIGVSAEDAMLLIRTHAFTAGMTMMEVSDRILTGRLAFSHVDDRIEVSS